MKIIKTSDVKNHHIFALIVGASGAGKTTLASTLPHSETLILSLESGLLSIKDSDIDVVEINTFNDLVDVFKFLSNGQNKYKHVFIDSLTELGEMLFAELKPNYDKSKNFALYEDYSEKVVRFLKAMRDMTQYNFWMTCLDKMTEKDFTQVITLDLHQKSLSKKIPKLFDEVFYLTVVNKDDEIKRAIVTDNTLIDFAKDRSGKLNKYEAPNLGNIYNKIFETEKM